jgi:signal transduction histidine kinase
VKRHTVHVAILDLCMAGIDGIETLKRLKEVDPAVEAIMLTAYSDMNSTVAALRLSACDYQKKPFNVPELEAAVRRALQRRLRAESLRGAEHRLQALMENLNTMAEREAALLNTTTTLEGVLHDINNPLTVVLGYAQLVSERLDSAKSGAALDIQAMEAELEVIRRHVEVCSNITDRYHALQRSADDNTWSDVNQALHDFEMFAAAHPAIRKEHLRVERLPANAHVPVSATELVQILINLVANAFQHGGTANVVKIDVTIQLGGIDLKTLPQEPGTLVRCQQKFVNRPPFVQLSVTDRGPGIPPEILARIFEPHFTTKAEKTGTGLGLSIVENVVGVAKGLIRVSSKMGEGTRFVITLPGHILPD